MNTAAVSGPLVNDGSGNSPNKLHSACTTPDQTHRCPEQSQRPALAVVQDGSPNPIDYQPWSYFKGLSWSTDSWEKHVYVHLFPPYASDCHVSHQHLPVRGDRGMCPTSNHPGVLRLFMDGSVHFIKNSVGLQPWWFMGTRGRGEIISSDSY